MSVPLRIVSTEFIESDSAPVLRKRRVSRPLRRIAGIGVLSAALLVLCLAAVGAMTLLNGIGSGSDLQLVNSPTDGRLSAVMGSSHRANGYVNISGSLTNISARHAANIEAVVEILDRENRTVGVEKAMVSTSALASGASAPISVIIPDDAAARGYRISFKHADGSAIE